jgi:cell division initiation protein
MAMTPRDVQNMRFTQKMRGYDAQEVDSFLALAAEQLQQVLADNERLQRETREQRDRLREADDKEKQLQEALLRAQRVADEIVSTARREAQLLVKEAELTGDKIVGQALEQATHIEGRITELRTARREVQLKFRNTLDLFGRILEADMTEEEPRSATVHPLPRKRR